MRIANGVFTVLLILFAAVQYNDPDGIFWAVIYGVGVVWCAVAAFRAGFFSKAGPWTLYLVSLAGAVFGVVWFWPKTPNFWMQEVWWETETAREGMGMMILLVALLLAGGVALQARRV